MDRDQELYEHGVHCSECRTIYIPKRGPRIRGKGKAARIEDHFCSNACRVRAHRRRLREQRDAERTAAGPRLCEQFECDNLVYSWERPDKKFCSNACRQKYYRECGGPPIPAEALAAIGALAARMGLSAER